MQNYYELLQIERGASFDEIKRAYARLLRKYNPERDEENFKKIREAFEVLSNPEKRKEYDFQLDYGNEFLESLRQIDELISLEEYEQAKAKLKKLTLVKPDDQSIWIKLSEVYAKEGNLKEAADVLLKATNYIDNSALIYTLLALCYQNMKMFDKAEFYLKKALKLQKDYFVYEKLYFVYLFSHRQKEAEIVLKEISKLELNDFNLIDYRLLIIKHYVINKLTINGCERRVGVQVKALIKSAEEKEEIKAYLINQIINELKFYSETELVFGLYYCWKMLYFITKDEDAKVRYESFKNILFKKENKKNNKEDAWKFLFYNDKSTLNENPSMVTNGTTVSNHIETEKKRK
ncbi:DnaJ domain-containing protein [Thermobrachium celere]|uniref:DnaJ domain-containing protein n=1 Tax=Thermobrachium celere TaxID=53422 RepID=UPI001940BF4F|nr:DnaJ domain-containing protein [Thermobrachium celere]GFR36587.1 hypothetical protein TCEA9_23990 [Thermobrachium celere]